MPTAKELDETRRHMRHGALFGLAAALIVAGWVLIEFWH
jgi:hypothetical protein